MPEPLITERLVLRPWTADDRSLFYGLNSDPDVSADLGGPLSREVSERKLADYCRSFRERGFGRWCVERRAEGAPREFLGYVGVMESDLPGSLGAHYDIGWRLHRAAWGFGFATEAARAALADVFQRIGLAEVLAYTAPDNVRSQSVMVGLGLERDESLDFRATYDDVGEWRGLVWVARRGEWCRDGTASRER